MNESNPILRNFVYFFDTIAFLSNRNLSILFASHQETYLYLCKQLTIFLPDFSITERKDTEI